MAKSTRELTCIGCPLGCALSVTLDGGQIAVTGNSCPRGAAYGQKEVTDPTRLVTSTVRVAGGVLPVVSVKTKGDVPKGKIFEVMRELRKLVVPAPVRIGDVLLADCAGTGVPVIATKNVPQAGAFPGECGAQR